MPRLFILILPLMVLWFSFQERSQEESNGTRSVIQTGRVQENDHDELAISLDRMVDRRGVIFQQKLDKLALVGRAKGISAIGASVASEWVERIFAEIDPKLLARLSQSDRISLRAYVTRLTSPDAREQPWLCWGPEVSKEKVAAFHEAEKLTGLAGSDYALFANQFLGSGRWGRTATDGFSGGALGLPAVVTWSIVPDGTSTPGGNGQSNSSSDLRSWMASIYGGSAIGPAEGQAWFEVFEAAFEAMAETCGITLQYEANDDGVTVSSLNLGSLGTRGDIRIAARALDGNSGTLAFAFAPDHGDMVFDSSDATFENTSSSSLRLFNIVAHELGHGLGLAHVCPLNETKLMEPILTTRFRGPKFDEHQSMQRLYGDLLESHGDEDDNNSAATATAVELTEDESRSFLRLSIDDNSDIDYLRFEALAGQKITATVRPGEGAYLEGGETSSGCSAGVNFNSNTIHDLTLEILAPDGTTVLEFSDDSEEGELEVINQLELQNDGEYFVRINGDFSNAAQLYRLDLRLGDREPGPRLRDGEALVIAESGSVKNGRLDPDETVQVSIPIENEGTMPTGSLTASVTGSDNVSLFSTKISSSITAGGSGSLELVFGALGLCGDLATLNLKISDESGLLLEVVREFRMGDVLTPVPIDQDFDDSSDLPADWASVETGGGVVWDAVSARFVSALRSAFTKGVGNVADSSLVSPEFVLASGGGTLSFQHLYRTEIGFDGAVLEVSRDGGGWFDLIMEPSVTVTGGYNRNIRTNYDSPIAGQPAWSARLNSFISTTVELPLAWAGDSLRFRWRLVSDRSTASEGWWVDNVRMEMLLEDCEQHRPAFDLELESGGLDENLPTQMAHLKLSSELPLAESVTVMLVAEGDASVEDFAGTLEVTLPAGQQSVVIPLSVLSDDLTEGDETLTISIPDNALEFSAGLDGSETLTITDLQTISDWAAGFFSGEVDYTGDSDGDGLSELAEYLLGTDPTSKLSRKMITLRPLGDSFLVPVGLLPNRDDATLAVEFSSNLRDWLPAIPEFTEEGLLIDPPAGQNFFRLTFSLDQ